MQVARKAQRSSPDCRGAGCRTGRKRRSRVFGLRSLPPLLISSTATSLRILSAASPPSAYYVHPLLGWPPAFARPSADTRRVRLGIPNAPASSRADSLVLHCRVIHWTGAMLNGTRRVTSKRTRRTQVEETHPLSPRSPSQPFASLFSSSPYSGNGPAAS